MLHPVLIAQMKPSYLISSALLCCLASSPVGASAAEGWFGGINLVPWINRADALLNIDRGDAPQRKRGAGAASGRAFDVELGYADGAGDPAERGGISPSHVVSPINNFRLAGIGVWNLGDRLGLTGRVGAYRGDLDGVSLYSGTFDASLHPTFGMGLRYDISANLRLQGGWDRYHLGQSLRPGDAGVDLLTIGFKYRF